MPELRFQATPRQWALIVVLGVVLVVVLILNRPAATADGAGVALAVRPPAARAASAELDVAKDSSHLPEFTAEQVAAFNPFFRPSTTNVPASIAERATSEAEAAIDRDAQRKVELEKALAELRSKKVRFVIGDKDGAAAMLGDHKIRLGQIVDGFRVIKIDQSGVELAPAE